MNNNRCKKLTLLKLQKKQIFKKFVWKSFPFKKERKNVDL